MNESLSSLTLLTTPLTSASQALLFIKLLTSTALGVEILGSANKEYRALFFCLRLDIRLNFAFDLVNILMIYYKSKLPCLRAISSVLTVAIMR